MNVTYAWLLAGVVFLLIEAFGMPGVGMLFAGLGALTAGALIRFEWIAVDGWITQGLAFFIATALWTALLWKPMQKIRRARGSYHNMIGETATVASNGLTREHGGEVTWSGTIMKAKLAEHASVESLPAGMQVIITDVHGATLTVKPKT